MITPAAGTSAASAGLFRLAEVVLVGGLAFAVVVVLVRRHFRPVSLWTLCLLVTVLVVGRILFALYGHGQTVLPIPIPMAVYMSMSFVSIPLCAAGAVISRLTRRNPAPKLVLQIAAGYGALVLAVPVAMFIAAVPDLWRLFGH